MIAQLSIALFTVLLLSVGSVLAEQSQSRGHLLSQSDHLDLIRRSVPLLENKTLTVCVIVREPFVIYNGPPLGGNGTNETTTTTQAQEDEAASDLNNYSGVTIKVVRRLSVIFRFNIRIERRKKNEFGVLLPDKGWTGLLGLLVRRECDIGATALSITVTRANWVDFTRAYYVETGTILLRIPEEVQNYSAIFEPFSLTVWIILVATILILIGLITVMTKLEEKQREQHRLFKLAKFLARSASSRRSSQHAQSSSAASSAAASVVSSKVASTASTSGPNNRQYLHQLERRLAAIEEARHKQEFGSTWPERFYYATSCVLNILLIRGEYPRRPPLRIDCWPRRCCHQMQPPPTGPSSTPARSGRLRMRPPPSTDPPRPMRPTSS